MLTRNAKIQCLMTLTRVPKDLRGNAKKNYLRLSDAELDARIIEFSQMKTRINLWRASRPKSPLRGEA